MRTKIAIAFLSISLLVSLGLASNQAFAGTALEDNFVHAQWDFPPPNTGPTDPNTAIQTGSTAGFPLHSTVPTMTCDGNNLCVFQIPNFIDELQTKFIFIDITFDTGLGTQIPTPTVTCNDSTGTSDGILLAEEFLSSDVFIFHFKCMPNPDWEEITIQLNSDVNLVEIWTESFSFIGGELIPIDTTSLIVAGAQMNAAWMIPVIVSAIGIGIVIARKF